MSLVMAFWISSWVGEVSVGSAFWKMLVKIAVNVIIRVKW